MLHLNSPLPAKEVCLTVSKNKAQLYKLFFENLSNLDTAPDTRHHALIITGDDPVPIELNRGVKISRQDLRSTHEEADVLLVQQAMNVALYEQVSPVTVIADDNDIFVLLLHFHHKLKVKVPLFMESPKKERTGIDIAATAEGCKDILDDIISIHAITGCDTVSNYHGIGKVTALKTANMKIRIPSIGEIDQPMQAIITEGKTRQNTKVYLLQISQADIDAM